MYSAGSQYQILKHIQSWQKSAVPQRLTYSFFPLLSEFTEINIRPSSLGPAMATWEGQAAVMPGDTYSPLQQRLNDKKIKQERGYRTQFNSTQV